MTELRRALKWALKPSPWLSPSDRSGKVHEWFNQKLAGLVAYGIGSNGLSAESLLAVKLHTEEGMPINYVAVKIGISPAQVKSKINAVLDYVIEHAPQSILVELSPIAFRWWSKGCIREHCGGSLYWDSQGATSRNGEWVCFQCSRRYDADGNLLINEKTVEIPMRTPVNHFQSI